MTEIVKQWKTEDIVDLVENVLWEKRVPYRLVYEILEALTDELKEEPHY